MPTVIGAGGQQYVANPTFIFEVIYPNVYSSIGWMKSIQLNLKPYPNFLALSFLKYNRIEVLAFGKKLGHHK